MTKAANKTLALLALTSMAVVTSAAQANLLTNGSFESGLTGWQDTCHTPGHGDCGTGISTWWPSHVDGFQEFYGYDNSTVGVLSQTFETTPGQVYQLDFHYITNFPASNTLNYGVGSYEASVSLPLSVDWQQKVDQFTATDSTTTLSFFYTTIPGTGTLGLDAISVTAVPEPGTWALTSLGLAAVGLLSRRQRKG